VYNLKDELIELMEDRMNLLPKQFFNVTVSYKDQGSVKEMNFEEYDSIPYYPKVSQYLNFMEENMPQFPIHHVRLTPKLIGNPQLKNIGELSKTIH
tara:strand:+ start:17 stop:304 length:288 start_codon:yes stop_codon:yes gene_type:complete